MRTISVPLQSELTRWERSRRREPPKQHIGAKLAGVAALALLVGVGIWAWPELHRTIRIHRM